MIALRLNFDVCGLRDGRVNLTKIMPTIVPSINRPTIIWMQNIKIASGHSSYGYRSPKPTVVYQNYRKKWNNWCVFLHCSICLPEFQSCKGKIPEDFQRRECMSFSHHAMELRFYYQMLNHCVNRRLNTKSRQKISSLRMLQSHMRVKQNATGCQSSEITQWKSI